MIESNNTSIPTTASAGLEVATSKGEASKSPKHFIIYEDGILKEKD